LLSILKYNAAGIRVWGALFDKGRNRFMQARNFAAFLIVFLFSSGSAFAGNAFVSHFSRNDLFFVLGVSALVLGVLWVLNYASENLSRVEEEQTENSKLGKMIHNQLGELAQSKAVVGYCSAIFLLCYTAYGMDEPIG
jgi:hypothetical protein